MRFERFHFAEISSTNEYIKELIDDYDIVAVSADFQNSGRGRNGRVWLGNYGKNIYLSIGLNFENINSYSNPGVYQAEASLIIIEVLSDLFPQIKFKTKYPNDILAENKNGIYQKLSGILIENSYHGNKLENLIIGIGINCDQLSFPDEISHKATSLKILGANPNKDLICSKIIEKYKYSIQEASHSKELHLMERWKNELSISGKPIKVQGDQRTWQLLDILEDGRLKLNSDNEEKIIDNGDSIIYEIS